MNPEFPFACFLCSAGTRVCARSQWNSVKSRQKGMGVMANSLLITVKATANARSHSSPNQDLWAWLSECYSQAREQRMSGGRRRELVPCYGLRYQLQHIGLVFCAPKNAGAKGNPQRKRF